MKNILPIELKKHYKKFQLVLIFTVFSLIIITPLISILIDQEQKLLLLSLEVSLLLIFCSILFRLFIQNLDTKEIPKTSLDTNNSSFPILFENYMEAQVSMKAHLHELLTNNEDIHIKIMGVSMRYSWNILINDELPKLLQLGNKKQKIVYDLFVVNSKYLADWNQNDLIKYSEICVSCTPNKIKEFNNNYKSDRVSINLYQYDNIPNFHGILINNKVLFRSTCKFNGSDKLLAGQNPYSMFKVGLHNEAIDNIELFNNWASMYQKRNDYILKDNTNKANEKDKLFFS